MVYIILASFFVASDVLTNLVFGKFLSIHINHIIDFEVPAGTLVYPFTFLISDLITEIYNKNHAKRVVIASFFSIFFVVSLLQIIDHIPSASSSILTEDEFHRVFNLSFSSFCASSVAYLVSQLLDIQIYHKLKTLTSDRFLWLRNFLSISISQLVDTLLFFSIIMFLGIISKETFDKIIIPTFSIKVLWAVCEIPFFYLGVYLLRYINENIERRANKLTNYSTIQG